MDEVQERHGCPPCEWCGRCHTPGCAEAHPLCVDAGIARLVTKARALEGSVMLEGAFVFLDLMGETAFFHVPDELSLALAWLDERAFGAYIRQLDEASRFPLGLLVKVVWQAITGRK